uniref:uncharacterized protein n=1 Tax=Myxine glutinosa TaxID=7769 RepID=UPI00358EDFCA
MDFNWSRCIICQKDKDEPLKCPMKSLNKGIDGAGAYKSFLLIVEAFRAIDALPTELYFGEETADSFASHAASWHKSCHLKFSNSKIERARKRKMKDSSDAVSKKPIKRRSFDVEKCIFCEKGKEEDALHEVSTLEADNNIREMITELNDTKLMTRIVGGDLIALEAKYHLLCLVSLRNRYRYHMRASQTLDNDDEKMNEARAFAELESYIKCQVDSGIFFFKLSEIHTLYVNRHVELGIEKSVNKTRLKEHLLIDFPEAQEQSDGKNIVLVFKEGMRKILKETLEKRDFDEDAETIGKTASIIRRDILKHECFKFFGSFPLECQENSLPSSLKYLISLILTGPQFGEQDKRDSQTCLTIGQEIVFNTKKRPSPGPSSSSMNPRHSLDSELPLPIYIGINVHAQTRSKKLIQQTRRSCLPFLQPRSKDSTGHTAKISMSLQRKVCHLQDQTTWKNVITRRPTPGSLSTLSMLFNKEQSKC